MPPSLLYPFDKINPTQFLSHYSEWIYFTQILVFFISVAGITLRKHFDRPYVKPLIIAVGLMLTVGVFRFRNSVVSKFSGLSPKIGRNLSGSGVLRPEIDREIETQGDE
jgi:hypothetical protein